ncbi:MAG: dCTP deaminase [Candidatus Bipolaricaulia bacterium]
MFLYGKELKDSVEGIIHEDTQLAEKGIDLTVNKVKRVTSPADLDFGGGEEVRSKVEKIEPVKRSPEDNYGWWKLEGGIYIIGFNEELTVSEGLGFVVPLERLTSGGSFHPPLMVLGKMDSNPVLYVNTSGLNLKENARISRLVVWR